MGAFADEDLVLYDGGTGTFSLFTDFGDAQVTSLDAVHVLSDPGITIDGDDTITDYDFAGEGDGVDLDALFDALGTGTPVARAALVKITDTGADGVITVNDAAADFSITVLNEDFGGNGAFGQFTVAELAALGIDVGTV